MAKLQKPDLDEATLQIAKRILSTPPKQHKDMKLGKRSVKVKERPAGSNESDRRWKRKSQQP